MKVDAETLIEKIYIAPLVSTEFEELVRSLVKKLAPTLGDRIIKSELYTLR